MHLYDCNVLGCAAILMAIIPLLTCENVGACTCMIVMGCAAILMAIIPLLTCENVGACTCMIVMCRVVLLY